MKIMIDGLRENLQFGPFELSIRERVLRRDGVALPLGDRSLDILIYLAERPGEVVAKRELMDHVWSDVTVEEGTLRVHVAAIRKALGDGQFGNRYIANIRGRGYSFVGTVVPFGAGTMGRKAVLSEVSHRLRQERFDPGGSGKTTVALAVGRAAAEKFSGQVHFVDLGSLTDPHHVAEAVATSLRFAANSKNPGLELVDRVGSLKLLIILDSCEHAIEAVALVAEQLYQETD